MPYGFESEREQRVHLELDALLEIDGERVEVERVSDVRLEAVPQGPGRLELRLYVERYLEQVRPERGERSELAIGPRGIVSRGPPLGEVRLAPAERLPSGLSFEQALRRPVAAAFLGPRGNERAARWQTLEPTLAQVRALDWLLLALPELAPPGAREWSAPRAVPQIGQYELGLSIPLRHQREDGADRIRTSGVLERADLELVPGYAGALLLDLEGRSSFLPEGGLEQGELELRLRFRAHKGGQVTSVQKLRLRCAGCPEAPPVNTQPEDPEEKSG